jgi:uncharacterized repeat protein (TIGR01451 family)
MEKIIHFTVVISFVLAFSACHPVGTPTSTPGNQSLTLAKTSSSQTYSQVGESIRYTYRVTNTGTTTLGPTQFIISDSKLAAPLNCGTATTTIAPNQSLTCSAVYTITQADLRLATITNRATASGAGQTSAPASVTITNLAVQATTVPLTSAPTAGSIIRITFGAGQTTATLAAIVNPTETNHYVLHATQGQALMVNLTAPANEVAIGVNGPTGQVLKELDTSLLWSTTVTIDGDYYIDIASVVGTSSKSYTLQVSLSTSVAATQNPP